jgi:vacuolar-type H+-ATPase subunit H
MDILHLVDRLESLVTSSRMVPFSVYRLVDEDRALELIDQMRISIPEEVKQAKRVHQERDRIIAQAHEEAGRLVELARDEAEALVQRDVITATAERRAQTVIERAQREALGLKAESDEYVVQALSELEASLMRTLTVVRNGLEKIERERQQAAEQTAREAAEVPE